jgi:uncharacterized membrane protein
VQNSIAIISFIMAVIGGLATMFYNDRKIQAMSSIIALVFLLSFFINVDRAAEIVLQIACAVAFAMAVLGGVICIMAKKEIQREGALITSIVCLGASLLILFLYI